MRRRSMWWGRERPLAYLYRLQLFDGCWATRARCRLQAAGLEARSVLMAVVGNGGLFKAEIFRQLPLTL